MRRDDQHRGGNTAGFPAGRWRRGGLGRVAMMGLALCGANLPTAHAAGFDLDFFKPTTPSTGTFSEENGLTVERGHLDVGVAAGYAHRPLVLRDQRGAAPPVDIVRDRATTFIVAAYGITNHIDVGVRMAAVVRQVGLAAVDIANDAGIPLRPRSPALGDTDLFVRVGLIDAQARHRRFRLTLLVPLGIPTGATEALAGSGKFSFRPRLIGGWHWQGLSIATSVGYAYTPTTEVALSGLVVGKALLAGFGAAYAVLPGRLWLQAETSASLGLETSLTGAGSATTQLIVGGRAHLLAGFIAQIGAGTGLTQGAGSPRLAGILGISRVWVLH